MMLVPYHNTWCADRNLDQLTGTVRQVETGCPKALPNSTKALLLSGSPLHGNLAPSIKVLHSYSFVLLLEGVTGGVRFCGSTGRPESFWPVGR